MFGAKRRATEALLVRHEQSKREEAFRYCEAEAAELYKRMYKLRNVEGAKLPEAVMLLLKDAQHQLAMIRQSIKDRTDYDFGLGERSDGDLATYLAEDIAQVMRENTTKPQTIFQALSEAFPEVHFTVDWHDAVSMVAATLRLERIAGIIEGLELAGVIRGNKPVPPGSVQPSL